MSRSFRTITVNRREWKYKIGRSFIVANAIDNNEKRLDDLPTVTGLTWDEIERGKWKQYLHITPKMIADWLKNPPSQPKIVDKKFKYQQKYCPECQGDGFVYKDGEKVDCNDCTVLFVDFHPFR